VEQLATTRAISAILTALPVIESPGHPYPCIRKTHHELELRLEQLNIKRNQKQKKHNHVTELRYHVTQCDNIQLYKFPFMA
jgi:hypothetical protein